MGCFSSKPAATEPKPIAPGPGSGAAPAQQTQEPRPPPPAQTSAVQPQGQSAPPPPAPAPAPAVQQNAPGVQQNAAVVAEPPRSSFLGGVANFAKNTAQQVTQQATGKTMEQLYESATTSLSKQMDSALASSDDSRMNSVLDSALAASALGRNAPESLRRAADRVATRQLNEAIASENPKQLKGALVSAKRLNATEVPEFAQAVEKYREVRKLPPGWDVSKMVLNREGDKMVAKLDVSDTKVMAKFQQLLDSTHRKVYTRDRMGQAVPERLKLVSVTAITNDDLWGDYMVCRENIRRELEADTSDFAKYEVDTMKTDTPKADATGESACTESLADISASLAADFGEAMLDGVNEVFLFHGTNAAAADGITTGKFKVNLAGSNTGTLYGRGIYLAENGTKADEYTRPADNGDRFLLVCRAALGRVFYTATKDTDPRECESVCQRGKYHSVLGDRKQCRGTFREFIVFDEDQVYANYILRYRRVEAEGAVDPTKTFNVVCPPGFAAGSTMQVQAPDGQLMMVIVPAGVKPGQPFTIQKS